MLNWILRNIIATSSILCFAILCYLAGMLSSTLGLPPSYRVKYMVEAAMDLYQNHEAYFYDIPVQHLRPKRFPGNGVVVSQPEKMEPGVTFMSGLFGNRLTARLYASDGTLLREWPFDVFKAMPNEMAYQFDALTHGHHLYHNGDIVLVLSGRGLMRVSACGDILWQNSFRSHHALDIDDAGNIWTPTGPHKYDDRRFDPAPFRFDRITKFDPLTGRKIGEVDIINAVAMVDKLGLIRTHPVALNDMMHLNDVEILSKNMAAAFPMFEAGDLLLSSRFYNQIWVLDGSDKSLKWVYGGGADDCAA